VRRPWDFRQQKAEAFGKGGRFGYAAHAGTKDSRDAAQRVPTILSRVRLAPPHLTAFLPAAGPLP